MKRRTFILALSVITIIASLLAALSVNMFMGDVANYETGLENMTLLATLPAVFMTFIAITLFLYVVRLYQRPKCFKHHTKVYAIILLSLSTIGMVTTILCGTLLYHSFTKPYPFNGYLIIFLVLFLLIDGGISYLWIKLSNMPEDEEKYKVKVGHVFKTIGLVLFALLAFNRFGMFLGAPAYIYWRSFYMTFPFYLYLLLGVFLGAIRVLDILGVLSKKTNLILTIVALSLNVVLFAVIAILGKADSSFISAVSPAMPLERLMSKPIELVIHFVVYLGVGTTLLVKALKKKIEN